MEQKRKPNEKGEICTQIAAKIITKTKKAAEDSIKRWRFAVASKGFIPKKTKTKWRRIEKRYRKFAVEKITLH